MKARHGRWALLAMCLPCAGAAAQDGAPRYTVWSLFWASFDPFTVVLIVGSIAAVTIIIRGIIEVRAARVSPESTIQRIRGAIRDGQALTLADRLKDDDSLPARIIASAVECAEGGADSMREAAEVTAAEQSARWFRRIDMLSVLGHLGPLVGLAGTVWGMIIAFTTLGEVGGRAGAGDLASGIAKALFHTLLGLLLAVPCLLAYGMLRSRLEHLCAHATSASFSLLERIISSREGRR